MKFYDFMISDSHEIHCNDVRTKMNEGGSNKGTFSEVASQQNYGKTNTKKIKQKKI